MAEREALGGAGHANGSRVSSAGSTALHLSELRFEDFSCDDDEWEEFKRRFGLSGEGGFRQANFAYRGICESRNVVWLYPQHDHNGAFEINRNVCHRLLKWSELACSVQVRRLGSIQEGVEYLGRFPPDSVMHAVLGGHGSGPSLQWGAGVHGYLGVQQGLVGGIVRVELPFVSITAPPTYLARGASGYVNWVDSDGDAYIYFEQYGGQWVSSRDLRQLSHADSHVTLFFQMLSSRMMAHGSIFTDSCKSASHAYSPNLASFVAKVAGKGVRVIGSEVSFNKVEVKRFVGWHASLNTPEEQHAQRIFVNSQARCPSFALYSKPDADGNCNCRRGQKCRTRSGKPCPASHNRVNDESFLPFCGESWAQDPCQCGPSSGGACRLAALPLLLSLLLLSSALRD